MKFFFHSCLVFLFFFHVVCVCQPVLVPEMIQARVGIALDGRALGGGQRSQSYWNHRNAAPVGSITSSAADGFFLSSSHLRNLQIWWPVLRFRQLLHCSQLILRRQGGHIPQRFLFFFPELMAEASSLCTGYSVKPAMCSALSARKTPAGVMMNNPGLKGKPPPPTPYGKSV